MDRGKYETASQRLIKDYRLNKSAKREQIKKADRFEIQVKEQVDEKSKQLGGRNEK